MGMFNKILTKLGLKKSAETPVEEEKTTGATRAKSAYTTSPEVARKMAENDRRLERKLARKAEKEAPMAMVDVMSKLEEMSKGSGLNWKQSIVDLLKVLGIDSSYEARKELATELGCPEEFMSDSAKMNTWLHKTVLQKIAENGGNIPQELLD